MSDDDFQTQGEAFIQTYRWQVRRARLGIMLVNVAVYGLWVLLNQQGDILIGSLLVGATIGLTVTYVRPHMSENTVLCESIETLLEKERQE